MRKKVGTNMRMQELIEVMGEGNPGALTVLINMLGGPTMDGAFDILRLDDMNIRGPQIWVAFKDYCGQDWAVFTKAVKERDPLMVATINREMFRDPNYKEAARVNRYE
jgi:hypothetical protein